MKMVTYVIPFPDQEFSTEISLDLGDLFVPVQEAFSFRITDLSLSPSRSVSADPLDRGGDTSC